MLGELRSRGLHIGQLVKEMSQGCWVGSGKDGTFNIEAYEHAVRLWTVVLEISVAMAQFPSKEIARLSYEYRTLGLGFANIGGLLMTMGLSYDSKEGRALCGACLLYTSPSPRD